MISSLNPRAYRGAVAVTPHATNPIGPCRALLATVGGNVAIRLEDDAADVILPIVANVLLPVAATHVRITGTTATGIFALR